MLSSTYDIRLSWLDSNLVFASESELELKETEESGEATLKLRLDNYTIAFTKWHKHTFPFLKQQKCADHILFEKVDNDNWILHIIEFKKTVTSSQWSKAKLQFNSAVQQATCCMGILCINRISDIRFYTAFREDKLKSANNTNSVLLKTGVGAKAAEIDIDWNLNRVKIECLADKSFKHYKIELDKDTGYGEYKISS